MPKTRDQAIVTYCPDCSEPVFRSGQSGGKIRYEHRDSQKLDCTWHGVNAIGAENEVMSGVSKAQAEALRKTIVGNKNKRAVYVVTAAQNATPVHENALKSLLTYCRTNGAQLLVVPYRYKNPTSMWTVNAQHDDWWAVDVLPYLINKRVNLNHQLMLLGDIMVQPTATRPLEGFETITGPQSGIVGHPKLELLTVPTPQQKLPKLLTTTGAVTKKNYIPSKAGKKGEFHHTFGAVVVEIDGDSFHLRQLNMTKGGSFCDLLAEYDGDEVRPYERVPALVMGDTHVGVIDPAVIAATFADPHSIVKTLRPEQLVWHDVLDGVSHNYHDRGRAFHEFAKHRAGKRNVRDEVQSTFSFIDSATPEDTRNVIVASNHHDFLREWVENTDPRRDPENCMFWAETYLAILRSEETQWTNAGVTVQDPFAYWGAKMLRCSRRTTFLRRDQAYQIKGIEVGYHGDRGPSGARGSRAGFRKIGVKSVIGHAHAPGIMDGAYQVGTSSRLNLTYGAGHPSAWLHTHVVIYPNGKRSLVNIINGKWRARG